MNTQYRNSDSLASPSASSQLSGDQNRDYTGIGRGGPRVDPKHSIFRTTGIEDQHTTPKNTRSTAGSQASGGGSERRPSIIGDDPKKVHFTENNIFRQYTPQSAMRPAPPSEKKPATPALSNALPTVSYDDDLEDYGAGYAPTFGGFTPAPAGSSLGGGMSTPAPSGGGVVTLNAYTPRTPGTDTRSGYMENSSRMLGGGRWVTVFGFSPNQASDILQLFSNQIGEVVQVKHAKNTMANWIHIEYASASQAQRAYEKSGTIVLDGTMIGVKPFEGQDVDGVVNTPSRLMTTPYASSTQRRHTVPTRPYEVTVDGTMKRLPQAHGSMWSRMMDYIFGI